MNIFDNIRDILTEILDIDNQSVRADSYVIRDLEAESIDLLELAVALSMRFKIEVDDEAIFLRSLRRLIIEAEEQGIRPTHRIIEALPFLTPLRVETLLDDLDGGPVLQVADLEAYIHWRQEAKP